MQISLWNHYSAYHNFHLSTFFLTSLYMLYPVHMYMLTLCLMFLLSPSSLHGYFSLVGHLQLTQTKNDFLLLYLVYSAIHFTDTTGAY